MSGVLRALHVTSCMFRKHASFDEASQLVCELETTHRNYETAIDDHAIVWNSWMLSRSDLDTESQDKLSSALLEAEARKINAHKLEKQARRKLRSRN